MQIGNILSKDEIEELCGTASYRKGEKYFLDRRVKHVHYDPDEDVYEATVKGSALYNVFLRVEDNAVEAECDCTAYETYSDYCKHIAAVMLEIEALNRKHEARRIVLPPTPAVPARPTFTPAPATAPPLTPAIPDWDVRLTGRIISLFGQPDEADMMTRDSRTKPQTDTQQVSVEYVCHIETGYRSAISVEIKLGVSRLYVVQKIRDFLDQLENGNTYTFSKLYTFDPMLHRFNETDNTILNELISLRQMDQFIRNRHSLGGYWSSGNDKSIYLPPAVWEKLLPLWPKTKVQFMHRGKPVHALDMLDEAPSISFSLDEGPVAGSYQLKQTGLTELAIAQDYGFAVSAEGTMYRMRKDTLRRMEELKNMWNQVPAQGITISPSQVQPFLRQVMPELKRFGQLKLAARVAERVVSEPLRVRIYLDRDEERLTADVEFDYGSVRLSPNRADNGEDGRLVMRETSRENAVLRALREAGFLQLGDRFVLDGDEAVYGLLYGGLDELRRLAEVHATSAVLGLRPSNTVRPRAAVDVDSATDWLQVRFELEGVDDKELVRLLRSLSEKKKYHRLTDGTFISFEEDAFGELGQLMDELGIGKSELKSGSMKLPIARGLSLDTQTAGRSTIKLGRSLRQLLDNLRNPDNLDVQPPASLAPVLRDYQKSGFQWMKMLSFYGFGGILADDMGLGKTLQSIAYIVSEREKDSAVRPPVLIVCPASLVYNWRNELHKFAPQLHASVAAGAKAERDAVLGDLAGVDVLITSYPLLRRDIDWYAGQSFHALILDEAQAIKNHTTQTAQAVRAISATQRFALTGTPVENRLEELWSIYDAVFPDLFAGRKAFTELTQEQVSRKVRPFLLRRLKKDVLAELPDKIETTQVSELLDEQKKLYMAYLLQLRDETSEQLRAEGFQKSRMKILAGLTRLRQLCCHPSLFIEDYKGGSGKLEQLLELIDECRESGRRMLIFSQFTSMLAIIRNEVEVRGMTPFYLDGATKAAERVELCRRFNEGETDLFLISLKAGGTGLNLTGADTVILFDLWWNPAVEQQAADRAHRIGQKKVVQVIRLLTEGTIEEKMHELQQRKKDLIDAVVQPGEEGLSSLTEQDIRELLAIG